MFPGGSLLRASSLPYAWLDPRVRVRDRCFVQLISVRSCVYTKCRRNPRVVEKREKGKGGRERKKEKKSATVTRHHQGREESRAEVREPIVSKEKRKKERKEKCEAAHKSWCDRVTAISFSLFGHATTI